MQAALGPDQGLLGLERAPFTGADAAVPFAKVSEGQYQFDNGGRTACTKTSYCPFKEGQGFVLRLGYADYWFMIMYKGVFISKGIRDTFWIPAAGNNIVMDDLRWIVQCKAWNV